MVSDCHCELSNSLRRAACLPFAHWTSAPYRLLIRGNAGGLSGHAAFDRWERADLYTHTDRYGDLDADCYTDADFDAHAHADPDLDPDAHSNTDHHADRAALDADTRVEQWRAARRH